MDSSEANVETSSQEKLLEKKPKNEKLACLWSIPFITLICLTFGVSYVAFIWLPEDRPLTADPEEFIGAKARYYLSELSAIGPRVTGSDANEITAVKFLMKEIEAIISESNGLYTIETDNQVVSGKLQFYGLTLAYESVQNVIVKITPKNSNHTNALLINSHYDSVVTSPGAGDDGSMVAVMLAVLNSLTKSKETVKHPIIFLLNGSEEQGLEAAHGFITQHRWAKDVRSLINLDAGGIGGKEILLQTGPRNTRLIDYYNKAARHPHGQVLDEEIFESGSLPADTDYTVFRDYGNLTGLNMVFISNGFFYHTYMDKYSNLNDGSLQHAGDNVLSLARILANSEELDENFVQEKTDRGVYFDVLGLFFVNYSETMGILINSVVAILSLVAIGASIWVISRNAGTSFIRVEIQFILTLVIQIVSVAVAGAAVISLSYLLDYIGYTMSWYSQQWLMFGLYCCPYLFISGIIPAVFLECRAFKQLPLRFNVMLYQHSQCVLLAAAIGYLMFMQYRSAYLVTYPVLFYTLSMLINLLPGLQKSANLWLLPTITCLTIPLLLNSYVTFIIYDFLLPMTGRTPGNQDLYIAKHILVASVVMMGFFIPIINMFRNAKSILSIFLVIFIVDFILVFTPIGFPYSEVVPQRQMIFHTTRAKHDFNGEVTRFDPVFAGYKIDRHVENTLKNIANKNNLKLYTSDDDWTALDFYKPISLIMQGYELEYPNPPNLVLLSQERVSSEAYRFNFLVQSGAKSLQLLIRPVGNSTLVDWSFSLPNDPIDPKQFAVRITFGKTSNPYVFWVIAKKQETSASTLSVLMSSGYIDEKNQFSAGINRFFKYFPNWCVTAGYLASNDIYEF